MKTKIIRTCETCICRKGTEDASYCVANPPRSDRHWPEVDYDDYCGKYEPENDQCKNCRFFDFEFCDFLFQKDKITKENEARTNHASRRMIENARRIPCPEFKQK